MNINDIVALSKAGFTAEQIAKMSQVQSTQPAQPITPATQATPPTTQQQVQQQINQQPVQQVQQPVQQAQPVAQPITEIDKLMAQVQQLTATVQANAVNNSNIPQNTETPEDILASIIDPVGAKMKEGGKK